MWSRFAGCYQGLTPVMGMRENWAKSRMAGMTTRVRLTDAGKTVLRGTVFVALAAMVVPAFGVLSALVSVLLVALVVGYVLRPRIGISGSLPERVVAGQEVKLTYRLRNVGRLPAYSFKVQLEGLDETIERVGAVDIVPHLSPGETVEVSVTIRPRRRGHFKIGKPVCESGFPFNLFRFASMSGQVERLVVLPVFYRLRFPVRDLGRHVSSGGTRLAGISGVFPEYAGNRPFVAGDSPRSIDSRAWARLAVPATKEYHDDYDNHAALVLDTGLPEALRGGDSGDVREFEAAVSLCASVAYTINNDCLIDMMLTGPDLHLFEGRSRMHRLDSVLEVLAGVEPRAGFNFNETISLLADHFYEVSEVIFVVLDWDDAYEQLLGRAAGAGCHVTVLSIDGSERAERPGNASRPPGRVRFISPEEVIAGRVGLL